MKEEKFIFYTTIFPILNFNKICEGVHGKSHTWDYVK
jgi:hypothetical protein